MPLVRFVNPLLLAGTVAAFWGVFKKLRADSPLASALTLTAIPYIWTVTGMATELPALDCVHHFAAPYLLFSGSEVHSAWIGICWPWPPDCFLAWRCWGGLADSCDADCDPDLGGVYQRKLIPEYIVFVVTSLILPCIVFAVWKGLVPPKTEYVGEGYSIPNCIGSYMYAGIVMFIVAPRWFTMKPWLIGVVLVISILMNLMLGVSEIFPLRSVVEKHLNPSLLQVYGRSAYGLLLGIAVLFVVATLLRLYALRQNGLFVALTIAAFATLGTSIKITHEFSSRYVVTALPLILIIAEFYTATSRWKALRAVLGACVGVASLYSYYHLK